ncbi:hypothetical protein BKA62DRAFT_766429 [Auriculariales sp. MPI-PUGE-AT-0066]|nr:hypothetical protein BKA62DRAFT_766429 [Auriculariales sp. MPI-PUGE-AT-0066]
MAGIVIGNSVLFDPLLAKSSNSVQRRVYSQGPPPEKGDDGKGYERFKPKKKVNDIFFLIFFLLQFAGFIGVSAIVLIEYVRHDGLGGGLGDADSGRNGKTNGLTATGEQV